MPAPRIAPRIATPGPPGFLKWLASENGPRGLFPGVYTHLRSNAPHVVSQAALHAFILNGLGQDDTSSTDVTASFTTPSTDFTAATASDVPSAAVNLPGGQSGGWADALANVVTPLVTGAEQIKLFNTQLALAQAGRPPLNTSQIRLPGVGVNVGVQPGTGLVMGGIAVGLGLLYFLFGRKRG